MAKRVKTLEVSSEDKQAQIDAAWAQHTGVSPEVKVEKPVGKVIFANREEIEACFLSYQQRAKEARLANAQKKAFVDKPSVAACLSDHKYHSLGDLKRLARSDRDTARAA